MCGGRTKPHKWAVLHQRSDKPLVDNGTTPSTQYHRCLPEEMEALGCAYGRSMDMVSIAQLAVEGNPQQLEPALFLNVPIQEGELGESWRRVPAGDTHQLRFRWLKRHPPLFPPLLHMLKCALESPV